MTAVSTWLRLAFRFSRGVRLLRTALLPAVAAIFVMSSSVFLDSQAVSDDQAASYELSGFASLLEFEAGRAGTGWAGRQPPRVPQGADALMYVDSRDLPVPAVADDGIYFAETDWSSSLSDRYELLEGRFPRAPLEVTAVGVDSVNVGATLQLPGNRVATVVGLADSRLYQFVELLGGVGTWAALPPASAVDSGGVTAGITWYLPTDRPARRLLEELREESATAFGISVDEVRSRVQVYADLAAGEQALVDRTPLLFWLPSLTIVPLCVLLAIATQLRRLVPAVRRLRAVGASPLVAMTAPVAPVFTAELVGIAVGSALGGAGGIAAALVLSGGYASPSPRFVIPSAGLAALAAGVTIGGALALLALRRAAAVTPKRRADQANRPGALAHRLSSLRRPAVLVVALLVIIRARTLETPDEHLELMALTVLLATLVAPEMVALSTRLPRRPGLAGRLAGRLVVADGARVTAYVAVVVVGLGTSLGVLVSVNSAVAAEQARQEPVSPPGVVGLDNDGAPSLPVSDRVRRTAEMVPALAAQDPVQLWSTGQLVQRRGRQDITGLLTTSEQNGVVFAVETAADLEAAVATQLNRSQRRLLDEGGMLVLDPDSPQASPRDSTDSTTTVRLVDYTDGTPIAQVRGTTLAAPLVPWSGSVAGYLLKGSLDDLDVPTTAGAVIYTGLDDADGDAVLSALLTAGINPEQAAVNYEQPSVIPDAALAGAALLLVAVAVAVAAVTTRAQVQAMHPWASRLDAQGVPTSWTTRVLLEQHLTQTGVAVVLGVASALLPLWWGTVALPTLEVHVPWRLLVAETGLLLGATSVIAWAAARTARTSRRPFTT